MIVDLIANLVTPIHAFIKPFLAVVDPIGSVLGPRAIADTGTVTDARPIADTGTVTDTSTGSLAGARQRGWPIASAGTVANTGTGALSRGWQG
jgi:uncharacterized protein YcfJ